MNPRVIQKYGNRRFYDSATSTFLTPRTIAKLIRQGESVQVINHATGEDMTAATMAHIILEEERIKPKVKPASLARIIRSVLDLRHWT